MCLMLDQFLRGHSSRVCDISCLDIHLSRIMSISFASIKHLKLHISIKLVNSLYLHDSYTTKFAFMNYAFAKLVVAW